MYPATRVFPLALVLILATPLLPGQVTFDVQAPVCGTTIFPIGCGAAGDPEGVSWNGAGFATVDTANGTGMPCAGPQYGRLGAFGPFSVPQGGPAPEPAVGVVSELYIPIPATATTVDLCWEFINGEGGPQPTFNDGMSIDITGTACSPSLFNIAYADTFSPLGPGVDTTACSLGGTEIAPAGPQITGPIQLLPGDAYVRVICWNGGDDQNSSDALIDDVIFTTGPSCALSITSTPTPAGTQIDIQNTGCTPGSNYFTCITLNQGPYPNGFWFGIEPSITELFGQFSNPNPPFSGFLDATGSSNFSVTSPVPLGVTVYAVTVEFSAGFVTQSTAPISATL
jgi:hypothetical protein